MSDIATDLPKLKTNILNGAKSEKAKPAAKKASAPKAKKAEPAKKETKTASPKASAKVKAKATAKPAKSEKASAKTEKKAPAKASAAITAEAVVSKISKLVSGGKVEAVKTVDYASSKSVVEGLATKAAIVLTKTFSDKAIAAVSHENSDITKAVKAVLVKNAASVRNEVVAKAAKKYAAAIVKAAKAADAGKLTAADYRAVSFA